MLQGLLSPPKNRARTESTIPPVVSASVKHKRLYRLKGWITKGIVLLAFFFAPPTEIKAQEVKGVTTHTDRRLLRIKTFFRKRVCPAHEYAAEFLFASDKQKLDWRLLPAIALIESSGAKVFSNNNIFGWDSCRRRFPSVIAGIHIVADHLANAPHYRGKSIDEKLKTYNSRPHYRVAVKKVMVQLEMEPIAY